MLGPLLFANKRRTPLFLVAGGAAAAAASKPLTFIVIELAEMATITKVMLT